MSAKLEQYVPVDAGLTLSGKNRQQIWPDNSFYSGFDARQHLRVLHPGNSRNPSSHRRGIVSFVQRTRGCDRDWTEWAVPVGDAIQQAADLLREQDGRDIYISQQTFGRWRGIADLSALGANYVDIDYHKIKDWSARPATDVVAAVLYSLEEDDLPAPSYILSTGRGLACVWLTELLPPIVLPRWTVVQKVLARALERFGADMRALDAARVFRLSGSVNSSAEKSRSRVGMVWCQGSPEVPKRFDFGALADEVLPHTQAEIVLLRTERIARRKDHREQGERTLQRLTKESYWYTVHDDLQKLRRYRNPQTGALRSGQRDAWLFVAANALAWTDAAENMEREIRILAMQAAGWTEKESKARLGAVVKRAHRAARGEMISFNGCEVDPRYRMRASTIVEWLEIEPAEMTGADLRVLIDSDRRRERGAERQAASRRRRGSKDRNARKVERLELGRQCLSLAESGMNRKDIATRLCISTGLVSKAIAEVKVFS